MGPSLDYVVELILEKALACGMRDDGLRKIEAGITTIEEVLSAVSISNT